MVFRRNARRDRSKLFGSHGPEAVDFGSIRFSWSPAPEDLRDARHQREIVDRRKISLWLAYSLYGVEL